MTSATELVLGVHRVLQYAFSPNAIVSFVQAGEEVLFCWESEGEFYFGVVGEEILHRRSEDGYVRTERICDVIGSEVAAFRAAADVAEELYMDGKAVVSCLSYYPDVEWPFEG